MADTSLIIKLGQAAGRFVLSKSFSMSDQSSRRDAASALHGRGGNLQNPHRYGRHVSKKKDSHAGR